MQKPDGMDQRVFDTLVEKLPQRKDHEDAVYSLVDVNRLTVKEVKRLSVEWLVGEGIPDAVANNIVSTAWWM